MKRETLFEVVRVTKTTTVETHNTLIRLRVLNSISNCLGITYHRALISKLDQDGMVWFAYNSECTTLTKFINGDSSGKITHYHD